MDRVCGEPFRLCIALNLTWQWNGVKGTTWMYRRILPDIKDELEYIRGTSSPHLQLNHSHHPSTPQSQRYNTQETLTSLINNFINNRHHAFLRRRRFRRSPRPR